MDKPANIFTVGGTVQASGGKYVERKVDEELLGLCETGDYAFVLTARQMGKSSLMVRTAGQLAQEGAHPVIIDLSALGAGASAEAWYVGLLSRLEDSLDLDTDIFHWWDANQHMSHAQRLVAFFETIVLQEVDGRIVVFIDEIDTTLSMTFTDDFFAALRYMYNARSRLSPLKRLSFVLVGVASPSDLMSDPKRTPFNIGTRVQLTYFTEDEAMPFAEGFSMDDKSGRQVMRWVLKWTGGHPFLTQRLCAAIANAEQTTWTESQVDILVSDTFFGDRADQDSNLQFVRDMLTRRAPEPKISVLETYRDIRSGRRIKDNEQSVVKTHLKLSGVVQRVDRALAISNKIYNDVFDRKWIKEVLPEHWLKRVPGRVRVGVATTFIVLLAIVSMLAITRWRDADRQVEELRIAKETAEENQDLYLAQRDTSRALTRIANTNRDLAEERRLEAESNLERAQKSEAIAIAKTASADSARVDADSARALAEAERVRARDAEKEAISAQQEAERLQTLATGARKKEVGLALARHAVRQAENGETELAALLALQGHAFNQSSGGAFTNDVFDALQKTADLLEPGSGQADTLLEADDWIRAVAHNPQTGRMAVSGHDGKVSWFEPDVDGSRNRLTLYELDGVIRELAISTDGDLLAALYLSTEGENKLLTWRNFAESTPPDEHNVEGAASFAISPDGQTIAVAVAQTIRFSNIEGSTLRNAFSSNECGNSIVGLAYNNVGSTLASTGSSGEVCLWSAQSGEASYLGAHESGRPATSIAFSPDDVLVASGGDEGNVILWPVDQNDDRHTLSGHLGPITSLAFSPDGRRLASASGDATVRLWETANTSVAPVILRGHQNWVWSVVFVNGGRHLVSGSADRSALLWTIDVASLAESICEAGLREMTTDEWTAFVGSDLEDPEPCGSSATSQSTLTSPNSHQQIQSESTETDRGKESTNLSTRLKSGNR